MAITDIQISEELETNAPSIKYSGNEGPKSPQEMEQMMMAQLEEEYLKYVDDMMEQGIEPMSLEQFLDQAMAEGQMSGGNPLPSDPTKPVNPFQPKPTGPVLPNRQMAAYGGIMGLDGRKQYGFGSSLKKKIRNIIPNELADIAVKAAPFVAPFNPIAAGLMRGVGRFDQRGSISDALKQGLGTYGLGQAGRYLGGADLQGASLKMPSGNYFSKPTGSGGIKNLFKEKATISEGIPRISGGDYGQFAEPTNLYDEVALTKGNVASKVGVEAAEETAKKTFPKKIMDSLSEAGLGNNLVTGLLVGGLGASALMGNMEPEEIQDMQRGEGLDIEGIRTEVVEAMKDPSGEALEAIRIKYPFLGTQRSKNMANGGRIGYADAGAVLSKEQIAMMQNMVKKGMDNSTISTVANVSPEQVQNYIDSLRVKMENKAYGGRIGFDDGGSTSDTPLMDRVKELQNEGLDISSAIAQAIEELQARDKKAEGGIMDLGGKEKDYRNTGGFVDLGAKEKADDVPARLSVNEFVFTADAVRNAGGGDIDQGAEVMENMMKHLEQGGQVSEESQGMAGARDMFATSQRLSEVI